VMTFGDVDAWIRQHGANKAAYLKAVAINPGWNS